MAVIKDYSIYCGLGVLTVTKALEVDEAWLVAEMGLPIKSFTEEFAKSHLYGPQVGTQEICRLSAYVETLIELGVNNPAQLRAIVSNKVLSPKLVPGAPAGKQMSLAEYARFDDPNWFSRVEFAKVLTEEQAEIVLKAEDVVLEVQEQEPETPKKVAPPPPPQEKKWSKK